MPYDNGRYRKLWATLILLRTLYGIGVAQMPSNSCLTLQQKRTVSCIMPSLWNSRGIDMAFMYGLCWICLSVAADWFLGNHGNCSTYCRKFHWVFFKYAAISLFIVVIYGVCCCGALVTIHLVSIQISL
jgi:hypothetical protein